MKGTTPIGERRHLVTVDNPGPPVPDGDGGFTTPWLPLDPAQWWVRLQPATGRDLERVAATATVLSTASHLVTGPWHPGITTKTRLTLGPRHPDDTLPAGSREFNVTGVSNPEERNVETIAVCVELVL